MKHMNVTISRHNVSMGFLIKLGQSSRSHNSYFIWIILLLFGMTGCAKKIKSTVQDSRGEENTAQTVSENNQGTTNGQNEGPALASAVIKGVNAINSDGFYKVGDVITLNVLFSDSTVVTNGQDLRLLMETGTIDRSAIYVSGSGSNTLTFTYTVEVGDTSANLDYAGTAALTLGGTGAIKDGSGNNVNLILPDLGTAASLGVQKKLVIDTLAPNPPSAIAFSRLYYDTAESSLAFTAGSSSDMDRHIAKICSNQDCVTGCGAEQNVSKSPVTFSLTEGTAFYGCIKAVDNAGNHSSFAVSSQPALSDLTAPIIDIGRSRLAGTSFTIRPRVTDSSPVTYSWSKVSGPGTVTFGSPTSKDTLIDATVEGTYVIGISATDIFGRASQTTFQLTWDRSKLVSIGRTHSCAIKAGGKLMCWGRNLGGENGNGDNFMQTSPQVVNFEANRSVLSVALAGGHTCAILDDSTVRCWGQGNDNFSTGYSDSVVRVTPTTEPVDLGAGRGALALAAGVGDFCVILDNRSVKCWGNNSYGKLGYGDTTSRPASQTTPLDLGSGRTAAELALGDEFSCVRLDDGDVKCWGYNVFGQLGNGNTTDVYTPPATPISFPGGLKAKQIAAGRQHACAILSDDSIACWGNNGGWVLGDLSNINRSSPVLVSGFTGTPSKLAIGGTYSCALRTNGTVSCWGRSFGVIGAGRNFVLNSCSDGVSVTSAACVAAGAVWSVDLANDCSNGLSLSPSACTASGGSWGSCSDAKKISSGTCTGGTLVWDPNKFAYCSDGTQTATAFCTSKGGIMQTDGYCSDPAYTSRAPCLNASKTWYISRIPGPNFDFGVGRTPIVLNSSNMGSWLCAVLDNLDLKCWGDNTYGQLGYGDSHYSTSFTPINLGSGETAQSIAASVTHSCALTGAGSVKCWGDNTNGRLGIGNFISNYTPSTVSLGTTATQVSSIGAHTCAVLSNGSLSCWGINSSGQLGNGNLTIAESSSPLSVTGIGGSVAEVAAGNSSTCALLVNGDVKCWGLPSNGRLGVGISAAATSCSDGVSTAMTACTNAGGIWNTELFNDCSNGLSTSQAACQAISNGVWAHCSDGKQPTSALCTTAGKVWDATPTSNYNYCTDSSKTTTATTVLASNFCKNNNGSFANYGYCADSTYLNRTTCLNAAKEWRVNTLPSLPLDLGGIAATQIVAGNSANCALLQNKTVRCWGANTNSQIGVGDTDTTTNYLKPAATIDFRGSTVKKISAVTTTSGGFCAILSDDSLRCWGSNGAGQLGYTATSTPYAAPAAISVAFGAGRSVLDVAGDGDFTCANIDDGTLRCFGAGLIKLNPSPTPGVLSGNLLDQLSFGLNLGTTATPRTVVVSTGRTLVCVIFADGALRCMGQNTNGQLGQGSPTFRGLPPATAVINLGSP